MSDALIFKVAFLDGTLYSIEVGSIKKDPILRRGRFHKKDPILRRDGLPKRTLYSVEKKRMRPGERIIKAADFTQSNYTALAKLFPQTQDTTGLQTPRYRCNPFLNASAIFAYSTEQRFCQASL